MPIVDAETYRIRLKMLPEIMRFACERTFVQESANPFVSRPNRTEVFSQYCPKQQ